MATKKDPLFYVDIMEFKKRKPAKRMGPFPWNRAEKIDRGANINLNHERFYTRTVVARKR